MRIKINGHSWTYNILSLEDYKDRHGDDSSAITDIDRRTMHFKLDTCTFTIIVHELVHAFKSYLCLEDTNTIDDSDYEEIYATFFSKNCLIILDCALKMYVKLHKEDPGVLEIKTILPKIDKLCKKL